MNWLKRFKRLAVSSLGPAIGLALISWAGSASADPLWAVVRYDGSVSAGKNVESVTRIGPGWYAVEFNRREIVACAYIATIGGSVPFDYPPAGQIAVLPSPTRTGVWVLTKTIDGYSVDRPFHVKVFC